MVPIRDGAGASVSPRSETLRKGHQPGLGARQAGIDPDQASYIFWVRGDCRGADLREPHGRTKLHIVAG